MQELRRGTFPGATRCLGMTYENRTTFENRVKRPANSMEREARLAKQRVEAEKALADRKRADEAFRANYERLKAERLARESEQ